MAADACQERLAEGRWRLARFGDPYEAYMGRTRRYREYRGWQGRNLAQCRPWLTDCQPSLVAPVPAARFHGLAPG